MHCEEMMTEMELENTKKKWVGFFWEEIKRVWEENLKASQIGNTVA